MVHRKANGEKGTLTIVRKHLGGHKDMFLDANEMLFLKAPKSRLGNWNNAGVFAVHKKLGSHLSKKF
jgi:hypothetical protein